MTSSNTMHPVRIAAEQRLKQGDIKLLSLDIFETLLHRIVPAPIDVFLRIGKILEQRGILGAGIKPDSFAALRYQTEYEARANRQRNQGDREVTLSEIYAAFPPHTVLASVDDLCALEIESEGALTFADLDMIQLAHAAAQQGIKVALISNMYLGHKDIERILNQAGCQLPDLDGFYVSSDHRCGKRTGLMKKMLDELGIAPHKALHIGDNPVSDKLAAQEVGMNFIDSGDTDGFYASLTQEHPRQWHERANFYANSWGDAGMTSLRRLMNQKDPYRLYGARQIGPLLTGFAAWIGARCSQDKVSTLYGLLREGDFLTQLVGIQEPTLNSRTLAASRLAVALAGFSPDHPQHLEDFLTRRGFWTLGTLMEQLGFTQAEAAQIDDPSLTLEQAPAPELTRRLMTSSLASRLYERSAARRARFMRYLKSIGALDHDKLYLCDLGYAATIQRGIQRILKIENIPVVTHGFYLATAHVSRLTQMAGGIVEGFLSQNGNPNDFACAFCRSPEIVELSCMPAYGTVYDYDNQGKPLHEIDTTTEIQKQQIALMQKGMLDFARSFAELQKTREIKPDFLSDSWAAQMRALALRLVAYPTAEEAQMMGHWLADSDMGLASPRPIVSAGPHEERLAGLTPAELATLPRRDVPWLYGVATKHGTDYRNDVARLILRHK